jgi:hypothetical protein
LNIINDKPNAKDYNRIYKSARYGDFKIIKDLGMINKTHIVRIKFIETGYEYDVQLNQVKYGQVRDSMRYPINEKDGYGTKIYHSNNFGDYIILRDIPKKDENDVNRRCAIRFIETGYECEVGYQEALNGSVKDYQYGINYNRIYYSTRSGDYKIIEFLGSINKGRYAIIEFINTKNRVVARLDHIEDGNVLDPSVVNFFRPGKVDANLSRDYYKLYKRWDSMIRRCYNPNDTRHKTYADVTVCDRWMYFSNYVQDVVYLPGYCKAKRDLDNYHLDKDLLFMINNYERKIYSPDTCIWLHRIDNITISKTVPYMMSHGCSIVPLIDGNFNGIIKVNGIIREHVIYPFIHTMYERFNYYATQKIMCEIIK